MPRLLDWLLVLAAGLCLASCGGGPDLEYAEPVAATQQYGLGPGDKLRITVFGEETLSGEYTVTGNGDISFPLIGNVPVAGRGVEEVQSALVAELGSGYVRDPRVSAEVLEYRPYYILGEVGKPGEYTYSIGLTIQQAVAAAGGFTYRANNDRIYLKRALETDEKQVDLRKSPAFLVQPGDTIRIGERFF